MTDFSIQLFSSRLKYVWFVDKNVYTLDIIQ